MREILFKGKAINRDDGREYRTNYKNGDWVYGLISNIMEVYNLAKMTNEDGITNIEVDINTICQFTGKSDKQGNRVFENDILEFEFEDIGKQRAVVYYNDKYCGFLLKVITDNFQFAQIEDGIVVGNIFERTNK